MNINNEKRFAILIDGDNISHAYIKDILDKISTFGVITYNRVYGDWTTPEMNRWKAVALENSILPVQQYRYTSGKNATDSSMIIDAMDILYSGNVEGFCIVSSDSDFTRLASRLREGGMTVIGMGEDKTPDPFRAACNEFKKLDPPETAKVLTPTSKAQPAQKKTNERRKVRDIEKIERFIINVINDSDSGDEGMHASEIKACLLNRYSDFDVKDYGHTKFSKFLGTLPSLQVLDEGTKVKVKP